MKSRRHKEIARLFRTVCDLDETEREAVLTRACKDDADLRVEVEALLARDADASGAFGEHELGVGHQLLEPDAAEAGASGSHSSGSGPSPHGRFLPGAMIGQRYRVVSLLGRGGMGEVYRADDLKLGQAVALKFIPIDLSGNARLLELFHNEVRLSRQIAHPNVCRVHDIGETNGQHFLSMEYIDGEDLKRLLHRIGRLPRDKGIDIARQMCRGLAAAHENGVLHRDLKPANVMIDGQGRVRITDFGTARLVEAPHEPGEISGTLAYMAPEQLAHGETTVQSDLYSLGLVLHEMFTGEAVHKSRTLEDLRRPPADERPRPASSVVEDVDPDVERAILSCLEREPSHRPRSARSVAAALPGGNALELAIAAGETPSPEMIGAAGEGKGLSWRVGAACLVAVLMGMLATGLLSRRAQEQIRFSSTGLVQPDATRELLRTLGVGAEGADATWGLEWSRHFFEDFEADERAREEWASLTGEPPTAVNYWYRQSREDLVPLQGRGAYLAMFVTRDDPPPHFAGMTSVLVDAHGRLLELMAPPAAESRQSPAAEGAEAPSTAWQGKLLAAAGVESSRFDAEFVASPERRAPPIYADRWQAWDSRSGTVRIEAAAFEGRPVFFRIAPQLPNVSEKPPRVFGVILALSVLVLFVTSLVLARRNWRSGRADQRGALRLFGFIVLASMLSWLCQAHHVTGAGEFAMVLETGARALLRAVLIGAAYVGLEPHVRKLWPQTLVSWSRLLAGRLHDPIIGRDLLLGIGGGVCLQLLGSVGLVFGIPRHLALVADPVVHLGTGPFTLEPLLGAPVALGQLLQELVVGVVGGLVVCLLFVFVLRLALRSTALAMGGFVLFFSAPTIVQGDALGAIVVALWASTALFLLFRFGVLTVAVSWLAWRILSWPMDFDLSSPHVDLGLLARSALVALACYALYSATRRHARDRELVAAN